MKGSRQAGFGHIVTVLVIVLVFATVGYIGFKLYAHPLETEAGTTTAGTTTVQQTTTEVPTAPEVKSAGDLDKATAALDKVDPGASSQSDETTLDGQLDSIQ